MTHWRSITTLACLLSVCGAGLAQAQLGDVTWLLTYLGNPTQAQYPDNTDGRFPRNMWAVVTYSSKLYLGNGNANSDGPAPNAGPAHVWSFNPATMTFTDEYTTHDYEFQLFRNYNGTAVIPGINAMAPFLGAFYYHQPGVGWFEQRTIPANTHMFDLIFPLPTPGLLIAGDGGFDSQGLLRSPVQRAATNWNTWVDMPCNGGPCPQERFFRFFLLPDGKYYVNSRNGLYQYDPVAQNLIQLSSAVRQAMLPGSSFRISAVSATFAGGKAYLAGTNDGGGHVHNEPQYLMWASSPTYVFQFPLPVFGSVPRDTRVLNGKLYLLSHQDLGGGVFMNYVHSTADLSTWTEVLRFTTLPGGGIARAFEYLSGYLYIGLGCYATPLSNASGWLVRIAYTP